MTAAAVVTASAGAYFTVDHFHGGAHKASAFEQLQGQGQRLVVSEFGDSADTIVAVDPADVSSRTEIATVVHASGFGIFPVLSPDGKAIAYTGLPSSENQPSPAASAEAAVVDTDGNTTVLDDDVDLVVPPIWSPDSQSIVVRKNTPEEDSAGSFDLILLGRDGSRSTITTWQSASTFPIAFSPDGGLIYFATLNSDGTDLYSIAPDGTGETKIAHLSDQIARDWKLSPDGTKLAYAVATDSGAPATETLDLASASIVDAVPPDPSLDGALHGEFSPAWNGSDLTVSSLKPSGGGDAVQLHAAGDTSTLSQNDDSIDLPLSWSPDGTSLAVRAVQGTTPADAQESHVDLIDAAGNRARVADMADVLIVGWIQ